MYVIRLANVSDARLLPDIEKSAAQIFLGHEKFSWIAQGNVQTEQDHLNFIQRKMEWVAVNGSDEPIGFINVEKQANSLHICELSVCQQWQGQGIGKQLVNHIIDLALAQKIPAISLTTFCDIPWNAPYYQRLGFHIIKHENLTNELKSILQHEMDAGFQVDERCAMVKIVN
ncbi:MULTISPECIES: GNAT family N-acetyltransferase [Providencia]|uniref:GNAT family N-acetyltransferase n=1 Tax=Providencia TaxID=586 RepID=UPI000838D2F3|nr:MULTISPECIES: GNAT family N-acetyltransferase [Providencia]MBP6122658.1 GNAT family N-acetyltransferase [Providencia sp.]MDD9339730.1 GNAT family N-acetyltransferase [Providencia heimbachae]NIH22308.1 GNAT family N-acetyltransferase [Providencia heimbachae]